MPQNGTDVITDFADLERLAPDWERLWKGDPRANPFGCFAWARAVWQAYGSGRSLCVPVVRHGGRVVGILPLAVAGSTLRFLAEPRSDYNDILCDPSMGPQVLEAALRALRNAPIRWGRCVLSNVSEDSNIFAYLPEVTGRTGFRLHRALEATCPCLDMTTDADGVLAGILKKKSVKAAEKLLRRRGDIAFRHLEDREEAKAHLPEFFRQHITRWAMTGERSIFCESAGRTFYESLVDEYDPVRELRFSVVELDGRPVAYHFGFENNGVLVYYKPTFDIDYWDCSPGQVLIKRLFEYAKERQLRKFDFSIGGEMYKDRFANHTANNYTLHILRHGPVGAVGSLTLQAKAALKRQPAVYRATKRVQSLGKNSFAELRGELRRHGVVRGVAKLFALAWRAVYSRDEVLVYATRGANQKLLNEGIEIKESTLSDLASLAVAYSDFLPAGKLAKARQRMRQGDKLYTAWKDGELAHIAWTGSREEIAASFETGDKCRIDLDQPSPVIYDCWTPPQMRGQGLYPNVLAALTGHCDVNETEPWIYCLQDDGASKRGIEKAGFQLRFRMRRTRLFHYLEFNHVSDDMSAS